jgi:transposase
VRAVALDVHRDFCEVAIVAEGRLRLPGRIQTRPEALELFAQSLDPRDLVALEVTGNAWAIARIIEPHVARVIVVSPATPASARRGPRPTASTRVRWRNCCGRANWMGCGRPMSASARSAGASRAAAQLVRARTRAKNEIHAVLMRCLKDRPPASDLFGVEGWAWLAEQQLALTERETVDSAVRQVSFLDSEIAQVERLIAAEALSWPEVKRLMTVPGVNVIVAATFMAAVGDIRRFGDRRKLTGYLGLDPRVRQSGAGPATHGHISKQGSSSARHALVEACWSTVREPGPIAGFYQRVRARRALDRDRRLSARARVSVLVPADPRRGLRLRAALADQQEDAPPRAHRRPPRYQGGQGVWSTNDAMRHAERALALQAQRAYQSTVKDRQPRKGASATPGRASRGSSKEQVARQTPRPKSAL